MDDGAEVSAQQMIIMKLFVLLNFHVPSTVLKTLHIYESNCLSALVSFSSFTDLWKVLTKSIMYRRK